MASTKKKLTRAEKGELTRRNLLDAAVKVVGEHGYAGASVTSITARARIAQGTFYNYFESRQDILDQVLPELGEVLLEYLGTRVGNSTFLEREERSLKAYFDFIHEHPEFYRVLLEAQVHSPESYKRHAQNLMRNYLGALRKNKSNGFLELYSDEELETLAVILLGARVQMMGHYCFRHGRVRAIPQHLIDTFMKFLAWGFGAPLADGAESRPSTGRTPQAATWFEGSVVECTGQRLNISYEISKPSGGSLPDVDRALQELATDLLARACEATSPAGARVRGNNLLLFAQALPARIEASCELAVAGTSEVIASYAFSDASAGAVNGLASGQAVLVRRPGQA